MSEGVFLFPFLLCELIIITNSNNSNNNNISFSRIARWTFACLIVFISFAFVFGVGIASAESGNITVEVITQKEYPIAQTNTLTPDYTKMHYDTSNYNKIEDVRVNLSSMAGTLVFINDFESTTFVCVVGATCSGVAYFDKNTSSMYFVFTAFTNPVSSPLTVSYAKNIFANVTATFYGSNVAPNSTHPFMFGCAAGGSCGTYPYLAFYYKTTVSSSTIDQYNVTYPIPGKFQVDVTKGTLQTKHFINSHTAAYTFESTYNIKPYSYIGDYADGLYLNVTMTTGAYKNQLINGTGLPGYVPPSPPPVIDPITGVGIIFDQADYAVGDIANISWARTKAVPLFCTDYVRLTTPNSKYNLVVSPGDSGYVKELVSVIGEHQTSFERDCLFSSTSVLGSDSASVGLDEQASYIYAPAQVGVGQPFNATYLIGWTKTAGSTVWLRDYSWDTNTNTYSDTYQSHALFGLKGVETNASIIVTKTGKHLLKICDVLLGCKASTTVEAYFNGSEVTTNISSSNITLNKISYSYGETMLVKAAVDNYNWSDKQIVVEYEDYDEGIIQNQQYIQEQIESFPLYISDLTFSGSGASRLRLTGKNSTGNYILAFVNFTLSSVDNEGYGLSVLGDTNCIKDTVQISVIVPAGETGNLTISSDDAKYNKAYTVNGTKTISYKYQIAGTYYFTLSVNGEAKRVIIKSVSSTGVCVPVTPTPTYPGVNGTWTSTQENIASTCSFWDGWVRTIFGSQGVNDVTRLQFALFLIGGIMFLGMIASRGNFGVAVSLGFIPYAFFAYLSLSSPCGQYMPLWVTVFIALIVCIKMKWF